METIKDLLKFTFYLLAILPIMFEIIVAANPKNTSDYKKRYLASAKANPREEPSSGKETAFTFLMIGYMFWSFVGLFTFQWPVFLFLILISLLPKPNAVLTFIDAVVSVTILMFILINAYHLDIDVFKWILSLF